jgi:SecD/SecF fusion protein
LATTFITLLPVASLELFGGDTLKDFAFALLVGIGSGAYSSLGVAAPLLAILKQREPEFQKRRDDLGALEGIASVGGMLVAGDGDGAGPAREPEPVVEVAPEVAPPPVVTGAGAPKPSSSKRERRRQRRASRPHGRPR